MQETKVSSRATVMTKDVDVSKSVRERIAHLPRDCIECDGPLCTQTNPRHRCSRCHCNYYCSSDCQKKDWQNHKPYCVSVKDMQTKHIEGSLSNNKQSIERSEIASATTVKPDVGDVDAHRSIESTNTECPICLEQPIRNLLVLKECNHGFCSACILQWQQYRKLMADLIIDFTPTGIDDITSVEVKRMGMNCPYCRTETTDNLEEDLMNKAMLLATRASASNDKSCKESYYKESLSHLNQILETEIPLITTYFTKAEILLELEDPQGALEALENLFRADESRRQHPVNKLLEEQEEAVARFDRDKYERLKEEVVLAAEEHGMPASRLRRDAYFDLYMLQCQAYEKLLQWDDALESYRKAGSIMDETGNMSPPKQRQFYFGLGQCLFEAGKYDPAIGILDIAISMNRHYPCVHKYKAWAQEKLGRTNDALVTMNRAALYETPWDEENQKECLDLYEKLYRSNDSRGASVTS